MITNCALVNGDFLEQLQKVSQVHPHALILREKDLPDAEYEKLAAKVLEIYRTADQFMQEEEVVLLLGKRKQKR